MSKISVHNSNDISIVVAGFLPLTAYGEQQMYSITFNENTTETKFALNGNSYTAFNKARGGVLTIKLLPNSEEFVSLMALNEFVRIGFNATFPITILNSNSNQLSYVLQRCSFRNFPSSAGRELKEVEVSFTFENYMSPTLTTAFSSLL
jgi:hypothetical protein